MKLLNGQTLAQIKSQEIVEQIQTLNLKPKLVIVIVGNDYASHKYVSYKIKKAKELNIEAHLLQLEKDISQIELIKKIQMLNEDSQVDGYIIQLPLPAHLDANIIQEYIDPKKDVDGLSVVNAGRIFQNAPDFIIPATPKGIISILEYYNIDLKGKLVAIVGKSNIVGKPLGIILLHKAATMLMCHSKTDLNIIKQADIIISATGVPKLIKSKIVKENAVIIDVGISRDKNNKLTGDVDFDALKEKVSYMTPVPGGVGPMTIISLFENLLILINKNNQSKNNG